MNKMEVNDKMTKNTITIVNPVRPKEFFVLKDDRSLERIAEDAPTPEGHIAVFNPAVTSLYVYVEDGNAVRPVKQLEKGQKAYGFPDEFLVYMRL